MQCKITINQNKTTWMQTKWTESSEMREKLSGNNMAAKLKRSINKSTREWASYGLCDALNYKGHGHRCSTR